MWCVIWNEDTIHTFTDREEAVSHILTVQNVSNGSMKAQLYRMELEEIGNG